MEKKEVLKFEADDVSEMGVNGKPVFFTKRINGETIHNKINDEQSKNTLVEDKKKDDELFIEIKNFNYNNENKKDGNLKNNKQKQIKKKKAIRNNKKKKKTKKMMKFCFLLAVTIFILIIAFLSPIFSIKKIEVRGNDIISSATIESLASVEYGKNIFKISKKNIINNVKENSYIENVYIKRKLPGTLEIEISERKIAYQVKVINSYVYLDYQGYILEVASSGGKVPQIIGLKTDQDTLLNGRRLSNKDITSSINTLSKIMETAKNAEIWNLVSTITINDDEYILNLNKENKIVYLGKATDLTNMMMYVKVIVDKEKGNKGEVFVNGDLNLGFKPYFREKVEKKEEINKEESKKKGKEQKNE